MEEIKLTLNKEGKGGFYLTKDGAQIGQMVLEISGKKLTVLHTEVLEKEEGKGYAKQLFNEMVKHARAEHLIVIPVCPYTRVQLMRNKQGFEDIYKRDAED